MTKPAAAPKQATPTQIENELTKGLSYAAQSHTALDEQERLTLLAEAENAYQNALCLVMKASILTGSPIAKNSDSYATSSTKNNTLEKGK